MDQELITIEPQGALSVFTTEGAIDPFLQKIRQQIDAFVPIIDTASGRKEIASMAYKVAQSKSYLEGIGKRLADDQKAIPKKIDACRKVVRDALDQWKDEARAPFTEWEAAEEGRVKAHTDAIERLVGLAATTGSAASLRALLVEVGAVQLGPHCEEFVEEYADARGKAIATLTARIEETEKRETEQAELAKLPQEAAERAARDREEAERKEAAERAERQAREAALAEQARVEGAAQAERDKAAREAAEARAEAERRELALKLEAEQANRRAAETEARIKREAEEKAKAEAAEIAKREADKKHRGTVNRAALAALVAGGIPEETARTVITLIASKAVPHVSISY